MIDSVLQRPVPADAVEIHLDERAQVRGAADRRGPLLAGRATRSVATVRAWAHGCALVSTEDASVPGLDRAIRAAARLAAGHPGPRPAIPVPDGILPPATDLTSRTPDPADTGDPATALPEGCWVDDLVHRLRRAVWAAPADLPIRDVRVLRERRWTAVGSTTGIRACGASGGTWVSAYLAADHPAEPADALVTEFGRDGDRDVLDRLVARVAALGRKLGRPVAGRVPTVRLPVMLRPQATARLLEHWAGRYLAGDSTDRLAPGDLAGSATTTLLEDPLARPSPLAALHDAEGLWTRPVTLLAAGRVHALLHTTNTAHAAGATPNACSVRRPDGGPRPGYRGLRLVPAGGPARPRMPGGFGFEATDVLVPPPGPSRAAGAPLLLVGQPAAEPPLWPVPFPLVELLARVTWLGTDPVWYPNGVEGRSVLVDAWPPSMTHSAGQSP